MFCTIHCWLAAEEHAYWRRTDEPEILLYKSREPGQHVHGRVGWQHLAFAVDSREWPEVQVPVWDADIATDTRLDLETVRAALGRLDGTRLVVDRTGDTWAVRSVIPEDRPL